MYNDTLKVANKIISEKDLEEIFLKMYEEMEMCKKQCKAELVQNEKYEREYQSWTVRDYSGYIKADVNFYDDTDISFDNFQNFMAIFNSRLHEIKNFTIRYHSTYYRKFRGQPENYISQHINMNIYENRMNIEVNLNSEDQIMNQIYDIIKDKILHAPEKYDRVIKKKTAISNKIGFAIGAIPTMIVLSLLALVPAVREIYGMTYVLFPIACVILSFIIGTTVTGTKLDNLYKNIVPDKKYAGYDSVNYKSVYKDDIDGYVQSSEIIIGKNVDNINNRSKIIELENKYSNLIPKELVGLLILSIIMILVGRFI